MSKPAQFQNRPDGLEVPYGPYRAVIERVVDGDTAHREPLTHQLPRQKHLKKRLIHRPLIRTSRPHQRLVFR
jgi:hypothetical protein